MGKRMREFRSLKHRRFLQALDAELGELPEGFAPKTVYIGGGTPTELPPEDLARVFDSLERHVDLSEVTEFSCEANPGTLDQEMAELLVSRGVDRISLGVQSFVDRTLEALGRIHNAEDAREGVRLLRQAGCTNLSVDLLFALPGTQPEDLEQNLKALTEVQPDHVSWYSLEFEPGTAFTELKEKGVLSEPTQEATAEEYDRIRSGLRDMGYHQYELFSFTRPGQECLHNINYWKGGEYLGCGPSAHSHWQGVRWQNKPDLPEYVQRSGTSIRREELDPAAKARERLMTAMRITEGVDADWFSRETGVSIPDLLGDSLAKWHRAGWITWDQRRLALTPEAYLVSDALFREFM
jgi:oxygen-independent coproporphyrinogen-3 oxidase